MASPEKPGRSKESLIGIWVGKDIKPEIELSAVRETALTGIDLNANGLAKEIFLWAWKQYRAAGSLRELKAGTEVPSPMVPPDYVQALNEQVKREAANQAEIEKRIYDRRAKKLKRVGNG
jgi:hypothetical protein